MWKLDIKSVSAIGLVSLDGNRGKLQQGSLYVCLVWDKPTHLFSDCTVRLDSQFLNLVKKSLITESKTFEKE